MLFLVSVSLMRENLRGLKEKLKHKNRPLDNYQAPYREPILAPTTNSLTNSNGIISILPAPAKFNMQTNRLPRNIFLPSILLNPSKPAQVSFSLD